MIFFLFDKIYLEYVDRIKKTVQDSILPLFFSDFSYFKNLSKFIKNFPFSNFYLVVYQVATYAISIPFAKKSYSAPSRGHKVRIHLRPALYFPWSQSAIFFYLPFWKTTSIWKTNIFVISFRFIIFERIFSFYYIYSFLNRFEIYSLAWIHFLTATIIFKPAVKKSR